MVRVIFSPKECNTRSLDGYFCTLPKGHRVKKHEAWGYKRRVCVWQNDERDGDKKREP